MKGSALLAIILAGFFMFGLFAYNGSSLTEHHRVENGTSHYVCPLMGMMSGCTGVLDHLSHWENSFTAAFVSTIFVLLSAVFCQSFVQLLQQMRRMLYASVMPSVPPPLYDVPRHTLARALSDGIIHPKLF